MDKIIELSAHEARELLTQLASVENRKLLWHLRICMDGDWVKFKVNESTWTRAMGQLDPMCRRAARKRAETQEVSE